MGELGVLGWLPSPVVEHCSTGGSPVGCVDCCRHNALQLLTHLKQQIGWQVSVRQRPVPREVSSSEAGMPRADCRFLPFLQTMHQEEFRCFYQFVFFLCREQGKRNVQVGQHNRFLAAAGLVFTATVPGWACWHGAGQLHPAQLMSRW